MSGDKAGEGEDNGEAEIVFMFDANDDWKEEEEKMDKIISEMSVFDAILCKKLCNEINDEREVM